MQAKYLIHWKNGMLNDHEKGAVWIILKKDSSVIDCEVEKWLGLSQECVRLLVLILAVLKLLVLLPQIDQSQGDRFWGWALDARF
jgi:hypothetical protein